MTPVVTGDVDVDALEDLVRLCVELDRLRGAGGTPGAAARDTTAAWAALEQAVIGKAVDLLSGSGGLASFLRRRQAAAWRSTAQPPARVTEPGDNAELAALIVAWCAASKPIAPAWP
jgi:hypothetical protein